MNPHDRADEALARARARDGDVVTPDNATSPMDAEATVQLQLYEEPATAPQLPTQSGAGQPDPYEQPDPYAVQPDPDAARQDPYATPDWPEETDVTRLPPNPYEAQRGPGEFGPLGSKQHPPR